MVKPAKVSPTPTNPITKISPIKLNPNNSYEVLPSPSDSVSSLSFSPRANHLVVTSWDNQVRCWEISGGGSQPLATISHDQPVLCSAWNDDGTIVFSGGCNNQVMLWPLAAGAPPITVGIHDAPVQKVAWMPQMNLLASSSWDGTIRYWDICKPAQPFHIHRLPHKCHAMAVDYPLMVVRTADRYIIVFDLRKPEVEYMRMQSPLRYQTRCLATFPGQDGFLVKIGSIDGRIGVHHLSEPQSQKTRNYTFKCHREGQSIFSVNSLAFHPVYHHTFASTGTDGHFTFRDKNTKQNLKCFRKCPAPIPCGTFNADGSIFAYAVGYDWSKGVAHYDPSNLLTAIPHIYLHAVQDSDVNPKSKPKKLNSL